jgi:hypothetical protein
MVPPTTTIATTTTSTTTKTSSSTSTAEAEAEADETESDVEASTAAADAAAAEAAVAAAVVREEVAAAAEAAAVAAHLMCVPRIFKRDDDDDDDDDDDVNVDDRDDDADDAARLAALCAVRDRLQVGLVTLFCQSLLALSLLPNSHLLFKTNFLHWLRCVRCATDYRWVGSIACTLVAVACLPYLAVATYISHAYLLFLSLQVAKVSCDGDGDVVASDVNVGVGVGGAGGGGDQRSTTAAVSFFAARVAAIDVQVRTLQRRRLARALNAIARPAAPCSS